MKAVNYWKPSTWSREERAEALSGCREVRAEVLGMLSKGRGAEPQQRVEQKKWPWKPWYGHTWGGGAYRELSGEQTH